MKIKALKTFKWALHGDISIFYEGRSYNVIGIEANEMITHNYAVIDAPVEAKMVDPKKVENKAIDTKKSENKRINFQKENEKKEYDKKIHNKKHKSKKNN